MPLQWQPVLQETTTSRGNVALLLLLSCRCCCRQGIVHMDLSPDNVLLDKEFVSQEEVGRRRKNAVPIASPCSRSCSLIES
jgi:hypothetical protein